MRSTETSNVGSLSSNTTGGLGWLSIIRLGLVQAALGSIVVLTTSTLNRVMVVELALAAMIPGVLVGIHYAVQITRPLWGHGSDKGGNRTRWILGGMLLLGLAGTGAAATTLLFEDSFWTGLLAASIAFCLIGLGIGACGTSLLALLASRTAPQRRPAAATIVWMMMIAGIIVTAITTGKLLDPYSHQRLITITAITGAIAFALTFLAGAGVEKRAAIIRETAPSGTNAPAFREALKAVWSDAEARLFTVFVFVSMLAYSTQDLILEPFGGLLFSMTPGQTTALAGVQHSGIFVGMAIVGVSGSLLSKRKPGILKFFTVTGCIGSGIALAFLALAASLAPHWPLNANIFLLGLANGAFAVAAIGTMMALAGGGRGNSEGIRMGVWGAAQAIAFGLGGFMGTVALDTSRWLTGSEQISFAVVFSAEAALFVISAVIAMAIGVRAASGNRPNAHSKPSPLQPAE